MAYIIFGDGTPRDEENFYAALKATSNEAKTLVEEPEPLFYWENALTYALTGTVCFVCLLVFIAVVGILIKCIKWAWK